MARYIWDGTAWVDPGLFYARKPPRKRGAFNTPRISGDYEAYSCPITGKPIEGRAAHRENLKRHGCRVLEKGESREAKRRREESFNAGVDRILKDL